MIKLHATKKLLAKLPIDADGYLPTQAKTQYLTKQETYTESLLGHWHANLLTLQRRNCILMVHDKTRFPLFIPCLRKPDLAKLDWLFEGAFINTLMKSGANQSQLDAAIAHRGLLSCDSKCNRSVQGTMNLMKQEVEHMLWYDNVLVAEITGYRVGAWLADRPCTVKGQKDCIWPQREMLNLLSGLSRPSRPPGQTEAVTSEEATPLPDNVVSLNDYR